MNFTPFSTDAMSVIHSPVARQGSEFLARRTVLPVRAAPLGRIGVVDALRGAALVGIALLHSVQHFDALDASRPAHTMPVVDDLIARTLFFLLEGKAYAVFAFLFGFSFFVQIRNGMERGVDLRARFLWRLALLYGFGYVHALFYSGDVLTVFALFGAPLVFLYKAPSKVVLGLAVLCMLQIPGLVALASSIAAPGPAHTIDAGPIADGFRIWSHGTFWEVLRFNASQGHLTKWLFMINTGRYLQMAGLILIGVAVARSRYFENMKARTDTSRGVLFVGLGSWLVLHMVQKALPLSVLAENQRAALVFLAKSWCDVAATAAIVATIVLLYQRYWAGASRSLLSIYGSMSLTNYVAQGVIGSAVFYGYGLAMQRQWGTTWSFCFGVVLVAAQVAFSWWWSKHHPQGPLEAFWRRLMMMPFRTRGSADPERVRS